MTEQELLALELHEEIEIIGKDCDDQDYRTGVYVRRVLTGWIYSTYDDGQNTTACFVPLPK